MKASDRADWSDVASPLAPELDHARGSRIVVVNLYHGGHHPQFLECLRSYWERCRLRGELHFVLSDAYRDVHPDLLGAIDLTQDAHHHLVPGLTVDDGALATLVSSGRRHARVIADWSRRLDANHMLLMYFDHVQLSLAYDLRMSAPLGISGILFRPTFHYRDLGLDSGLMARVTSARKRLLLRAAARNPHVKYLFCLDHLAVERFATVSTHARAIALPEPLAEPDEADLHRPSLADGVEPGRRRILLFGNLDERKGVSHVLQGLSGLGEADQSKLSLLLAGQIAAADRDVILQGIRRLENGSAVQVLVDDRYLEESEIQPLIRHCDLVLATYVRHVGSSGVLVRAARASVPVLATRHGVLGRLVEQHGLGATIDDVSADSVKVALERWLRTPSTIRIDPEGAFRFAEQNTADAFARTIFSTLGWREPASGRMA